MPSPLPRGAHRAHRARRAVAAVAAAISFAVVAIAPPANAHHAVQPSNRPEPIAGGTNGRLPASSLITVAPGCSVARDAAPSLYRLLSTARSHRVRLGTRDCYRPLDEQVAVGRAWTSRGNSACAAQPRFDANGNVVGTSMHGWGEAVDFSDAGRGMTFTSTGYRFLKAHAARLGWNHPGWAEPGGSACPEAWHWEWVGDGGVLTDHPARADVVALVPAAGDRGYAAVTGLGAVIARGEFTDRGSAASLPLQWVVVDAASTPTRNGYWLVAGDGGVFTFGDAGFHGSTGDRRLNWPVIGVAPSRAGAGYWLVASDGGVFTFGDAAFHGSTGSTPLNSPVVAMAATPTGKGYWLVAADGGVFTFGDAAFHGSTGSMPLNSPIVGLAPTPSGKGYWLVASDGGVFTFGDAIFHGSAGSTAVGSPFVGMTLTSTGDGYWITAANGAVFAYGGAKDFGPA